MKQDKKAITITFICVDCESITTTNVKSKKEQTLICCVGCGQMYGINILMVIKKGKK